MFNLSKRAGRRYKDYSVEMLIEITKNNKIESIPIDYIAWNLEKPVWGRSNVSPKMAFDNPKKYKGHVKRIEDTDASYPILIYAGEIIDGHHRLAKIIMQGGKTIKAKMITKKQLDASRIDDKRIKELSKTSFCLSKRAGRYDWVPKEKLDIVIRKLISIGLHNKPFGWFNKINWGNSIDKIYDHFLHLLYLNENQFKFDEDKEDFKDFLHRTQNSGLFIKNKLESLKNFIINELPRIDEKIEETTNFEEFKKNQEDRETKTSHIIEKYVESYEPLIEPSNYPLQVLTIGKGQSFTPKLYVNTKKSKIYTIDEKSNEINFIYQNKPISGIWTSNLEKNEFTGNWTSPWIEWMNSESPNWIGESAAIFKVKDGAKVYHIDNQNDFNTLYKMFPLEKAGKISEYKKIIDFDSMSHHFDGLHVTEDAARRIPELYGWDLDSTVWFNPSVLKPITMMKIEKSEEGYANARLLPMKSEQNKTIAHLINNLIKRGFVSQALDVYDILKELETDEADDASVSNIVGLRGETKPEEPIGGFTVSPQFFNSGDSF